MTPVTHCLPQACVVVCLFFGVHVKRLDQPHCLCEQCFSDAAERELSGSQLVGRGSVLSGQQVTRECVKFVKKQKKPNTLF